MHPDICRQYVGLLSNIHIHALFLLPVFLPCPSPSLSHTPLLQYSHAVLLPAVLLSCCVLSCWPVTLASLLLHQSKVPPFSQIPRAALDEPAVCLVCGQLLSAGSRLPPPALSSSLSHRRTMSPGECTLHARTCGAGTGVFYLVER